MCWNLGWLFRRVRRASPHVSFFSVSRLNSTGLQSVLSVIVSPLFSLFSAPKPIFIGGGKTGPTPRLHHPSQKIRPRHIRHPASDPPPSRSSTTLSSEGTTRSVYSNHATDNESRRSPSPNGTRFRNGTYNTSESPVPSRPPTPGRTPGPPSPPRPRSPRDGLRTYLEMRKRSTLRDETVLVELSPTIGDDKLDLDEGSNERELARAEIIVYPPTPSSSIFFQTSPGPSDGRFGDVSTPGKPAARFVKSHSKRHSLSAACPRKSPSIDHPTNPGGNADASGRQTEIGQTAVKYTHSQFWLARNDSRGRVEMEHRYPFVTPEEAKIVTSQPTSPKRCVPRAYRERR